jgi:glucosamine 6-phosphate synthetase-like amidotransferase/phosphosugar isomerase protein
MEKIEVNFDNLKVIALGANQYIIKSDDARIFQSYDTIIAIRTGGMTILDEDNWDYSRTTGKYRNKFLDESKADTERKIKEKRYFLAKLNKD